MLKIKSLRVESKDFVLKDISFQVEEGKTLVIIGPTGCGKTTLLEAILGLRKLTKGQILLQGKDLTHLPPHYRGFAYVPQDLALFPHLTVEGNITFSLRHAKGRTKADLLELAEGLIRHLGLEHLRKKRIEHLSGGEKQRVALARALASGSRYLFLDEPFSALHEGLKRDLWILLMNLQRDYRLTILMISHDLEETFFLANDVCVMIGGEIHQRGRKEEVYRRPATLEVAKYFGIKNLFSGLIVALVGDHYLINCEELNRYLYVSQKQLFKGEIGDKVLVGIRPEDVVLLQKDLPIKGKNLLTAVVVSVHPMGASTLLLCQTKPGERLLEVNLPAYTFQKSNLSLHKTVTFLLPEEHLFMLKET